MVEPEGSVSVWLELAKQGEPQAIAQLYHAYFEPLAHLARRRLASYPRVGPADEYDAVQSAMFAFFGAVHEGRYANLHGRGDLWRVLVRFVLNKLTNAWKREEAQKRGGGMTRLSDNACGEERVLECLPSRESDPAIEIELREGFQRCLERLDEQEAQVACLLLEGNGTKEIAQLLAVSLPTARRLARAVRGILAEELAVEPE